MTMPQPQRNPHGNSGLTTLEWLLVVALGIIYGDIDLNPQPAPGVFQSPTGWMPPLDKPSCNLV